MSKFAQDLSSNITVLGALTHPVIRAPYWTPEIREAVRRTMEANPDISRTEVAEVLKVEYSRITSIHKDFHNR
jgi:hypothetical protein